MSEIIRNLHRHVSNMWKCVQLILEKISGGTCSTPEGRATTKKHYVFFRQVLCYLREKEGRLSIAEQLDARLQPLMNSLDNLEGQDWDEFFSLWKDFPMVRIPPITKSFYFGSPTSDHSYWTQNRWNADMELENGTFTVWDVAFFWLECMLISNGPCCKVTN